MKGYVIEILRASSVSYGLGSRDSMSLERQSQCIIPRIFFPRSGSTQVEKRNPTLDLKEPPSSVAADAVHDFSAPPLLPHLNPMFSTRRCWRSQGVASRFCSVSTLEPGALRRGAHPGLEAFARWLGIFCCFLPSCFCGVLSLPFDSLSIYLSVAVVLDTAVFPSMNSFLSFVSFAGAAFAKGDRA